MSAPLPGGIRVRLFVAVAILAVVLPAEVLAAAGHGGSKPATDSYRTTQPSMVASTGAVGGVEFVPLINSGEEAFGTVFEGIPDGIGVVPGPAPLGYVDLYVAHEQSRVPFQGFGDYQDSSVTRVRLDLASQKIIGMDVPLSADEGFIRFCSVFMAGPEHGFPHYTLLVNEESNDPLYVPDGALYGPDEDIYGEGSNTRQAGYSAWLDTANGKVGVLAGAGRHNHENQVVVPGGWGGIVSVSGDDTFSAPSSQLYMYIAKNWRSFQKDEGTLWAFRVTATDEGPVQAADPFNDANDYLEISPADDPWAGEFIPVPEEIARGGQTALEDWSNANNVFQFIRVEDIAYDPDNPREIYFADTGTNRLQESATTGRLFRASSGADENGGRIFRMLLNATDPRVVDEFSVLVAGSSIGMRNPDNLDVGHHSIMVQEDTSNAKIWMHPLGTTTWTHVATATSSPPETSGIVDMSRWLGDGWWALDVQAHNNISETPGQVYTGPGSQNGTTYTARREGGQLLLMQVPGS